MSSRVISFLVLALCCLTSTAFAWEIPYPYSQHRSQIDQVFGTRAGSIPDKAFKAAAYGHYALSCYAAHRTFLVVEQRNLKKSRSLQKQMEVLKKVAPDKFSSEDERQLLDLRARISELENVVSNRAAIMRSVGPHLRLAVETLKKDHPSNLSNLVLSQKYQEIVDRFLEVDEFGTACRSMPDIPANSSEAIPFAEGWAYWGSEEQRAEADAQRESELIQQIKAGTPGCSSILPDNCPSDEEARVIARKIMAREANQ